MKITIKSLFLLLLILIGVAAGVRAAPPPFIVFAASSTTNALDEIVNQYRQITGAAIKVSYASSSTLAKQIAAGAPASLFISAHPQWMDYLAVRNLLAPGSRADLLSNQVVVIAHKNKALSVKLEPGYDFSNSFSGKLAMGDPTHVPAGIYGQQALESLGLWAALAPTVVNAFDTRVALAYVEQGECELGIVFKSDALASERVEIIDVISSKLHQPITYPVAIIAENDTASAKQFLKYLQSEKVKEIFIRHGFEVLRP